MLSISMDHSTIVIYWLDIFLPSEAKAMHLNLYSYRVLNDWFGDEESMFYFKKKLDKFKL